MKRDAKFAMGIKLLSLLIVDIGLFVITFILFLTFSLLIYNSMGKPENKIIELTGYFSLAITHTLLNIFKISKKSDLPEIYTSINTGFIICVYVFAAIAFGLTRI